MSEANQLDRLRDEVESAVNAVDKVLDDCSIKGGSRATLEAVCENLIAALVLSKIGAANTWNGG